MSRLKGVRPQRSLTTQVRMFTGSLVEEVKALEEDIEAVKAKVDDPIICEKVRLFVQAPKEIQAIYKADAGRLTILTPSASGPISSFSRRRFTRSHRHPPFWR